MCLEVLEDLSIRNDWEFLKDKLMQLEAGSNFIELSIPANVKRIQTVRYRFEDAGVQSGFRTIKYMCPDEFMTRLMNNRPTEPDTATVVINGVEFYPRTNRQPRYWTSFDEENVVFDSYDLAVNNAGIEATDSAILATINLDFTGSDQEDWVAPIPEQLFTLWEQECVAEGFVQFRQAENPRAERRSRRSYADIDKNPSLTRTKEVRK